MYIRRSQWTTGTHDNNTARGWFENQARPQDKRRLFTYLGREVSGEEVAWELVRLAMRSVAELAITPMQDVLGLGQEARMNLPAVQDGIWAWRLLPEQMDPSLAQSLAALTETYART